MSIEIRQTTLAGVLEIRPRKHEDARGFFCETYSRAIHEKNGINGDWVQENHSHSVKSGTLRGLHFQVPPEAQDKLVRVPRGAIFDVAVDVRMGSPTFGQWTSVILSETDWNQLLIPRGFAHGFVTLMPFTDVIYRTTAPYAPACERSVRYDDQSLAIAWPLADGPPILSEKDASASLLADVDTGFVHGDGC